MKSFSTLLLPLALAASALAHGVVTTITIDGKTYTGGIPGNPKPSIIRNINTASPVKGATNPAVNCGPSAGPASDIAEAMPGSQISFLWVAADNNNWPHNIGPMMTYMASCGDTPCNKFDSKNAKWFKIDEVGRKNGNDPTAKWVQMDQFQRTPAFVTIPKTIAPGNYLIRHEILALHLGNEPGGAEFYPSCAQLHIGGSQTGKPTASELVSLPGAYSDNDPGIFYKDVFNAKLYTQFPGPNIASFVTGTPAAGGNATTASPGPAPTGTGTGSGPKAPSTKSVGGSCKLKKKVSASVQARSVHNAATVRPRHLSRVMRGLIAGRFSS